MLRPDTFALTALLGLLSAVGPLSTDMYLPSLPDIGHTFGAMAAQVQLTISFYLIGFAAGQIVYGPLSDRFGRKPVLLAAIGIYCVASLLCALSFSIGMLLTARLLQALGGCGCIVLARAIVRDLYSGNRAGRELSLIAAVMAVAPLVAPVIGGILQTVFGWRAVFGLLILAGLCGFTAVFFLLPETLKVAGRGHAGSMWGSFRVIVRNPSYCAYLGLIALAYSGLFAWISGAAFVLQGNYGLSAFGFGVAFAIASCGFFAGTSLAARFVSRLGLDITIGIGALALAAGGLAMLAAIAAGLTSAASLVLPVALYLVGLGMLLPQATAGAMAPFPERAGAASSLLGFSQQSSAAIVGALVGALLEKGAWPMAAAIAAMGCASLLLWLLTRRVRAHAAQHG